MKGSKGTFTLCEVLHFIYDVVNVVIFIYKISTKSVQSILTKGFVTYDNPETGLRHLPSFMKLLTFRKRSTKSPPTKKPL